MAHRKFQDSTGRGPQPISQLRRSQRSCRGRLPISHWRALAVVIFGTVLISGVAVGADQVLLQFHKTGAQAEIDLHGSFQLPVSATYPAYTILRSLDMQTWQPFGDIVKGSVGVSDEAIRLAVPVTNDQ